MHSGSVDDGDSNGSGSDGGYFSLIYILEKFNVKNKTYLNEKVGRLAQVVKFTPFRYSAITAVASSSSSSRFFAFIIRNCSGMRLSCK